MLSARVGQYFKWVGQSPEWVGHGLPGLGLEPPLLFCHDTFHHFGVLLTRNDLLWPMPLYNARATYLSANYLYRPYLYMPDWHCDHAVQCWVNVIKSMHRCVLLYLLIDIQRFIVSAIRSRSSIYTQWHTRTFCVIECILERDRIAPKRYQCFFR